METSPHPEWGARQRVSRTAVFFAGLVAGAITFVFSGGTPWTMAGTMNAIMGRVIRADMAILLVAHMVLAWLYAAVIAFATYRYRWAPALFAGLIAGFVCFLANSAFFNGLNLAQESPESRVLVTHMIFSLCAAAAYQAFSVPRPLRGDRPA